MSSMCRNYVKCLHSLNDQDNHNGLCLECHLACENFIAEIEHLLGGHKLAMEDEVYLFLHRINTLEDLARHLGTHKMTDYLPTVGSLTRNMQYLKIFEAALLCLRFRNTITEDQLIELAIEPKDEEEDVEIDCADGENCPDEPIEPDEIEEEIDCKEDKCGEDIEEPVLLEVCPIEVIPTKVIPTEEPASEEISMCQTPILQPEVVEKPVNRVPIIQPNRNDRRWALKLIAQTIENRKLPRKYEDFVTAHMDGCNALEFDDLLGIITTRDLLKRGLMDGLKLPIKARSPRGAWLISVEQIIKGCDKHLNWITTPKAVIKLKKMFPAIVIDRNTLRKYVLEEGLCEQGKNLYGELAIPVKILPEVPSRYQEIHTRLLKKRGVYKDGPKADELTPEKIFLLLEEKISYKTVLDYLGEGIIPGTKKHGRWVSTPEEYKIFLQNATSGVRGVKPEHVPICRECLSKPYSITKAEQ